MIAAVGLAIAAGGSATLLRPEPVVVSPGNIAIPGGDTVIDGASLQRDMLEQLVADSAVTDPTRLPALTAMVAIHRNGGDWVVPRLLEPDVPGALAVAFAARLPRGTKSVDHDVDRLLSPVLRNGPPDLRRAAADALGARGRLVLERSPACGCAVGLHPFIDAPTLFAHVVDRGGLAWRPDTSTSKVVLHLTPEADGAQFLTMPLPPETTTVEAVVPSGTVLTLTVPKNR